MEEFCALHDLMLLYDEGATGDPSGFNQDTLVDPDGTVAILANRPPPLPMQSNVPNRFKSKSRNFPDLMTCPAIWAFLHQSIKDLKQNKWQDFSSNLTTNQLLALKCLQKQNYIIIKPFDKIGNIVVMSHCIRLCAMKFSTTPYGTDLSHS